MLVFSEAKRRLRSMRKREGREKPLLVICIARKEVEAKSPD